MDMSSGLKRPRLSSDINLNAEVRRKTNPTDFLIDNLEVATSSIESGMSFFFPFLTFTLLQLVSIGA